MSDKISPAPPVPTFNIGDKAKLSTHPTVGEIVELKRDSKGHLSYLLRRPLGTDYMSHWLRGEVLHLVEKAHVPAVASHTFKIGDKVRCTSGKHEGKVRVINAIDGELLFLYKDEAAKDKSPIWQWLGADCELVEAAAADETPAAEYNGPAICCDDTDCDSYPCPVAADEPAPAPTCDYCEVAPRMEGSNYCVDCVTDIADFIVPPAVEEAATTPEPAVVYDASYVHLLRAERDHAEAERAKLERQLIELQNMVVEKKPITAAVSAPQMCVEYKTVAQQILGYPQDLKKSDDEVSTLRNEGWQIVNITYIGLGDGPDTRYVMLERIAPAPTAPTIGRAGTHAALTGDFVEQSRQSLSRQLHVPKPAHVGTIITENSDKPLTLAQMVKQYGPDETAAMLDDLAITQVFTRAAERRQAMPSFQVRPLLAVKVSE